MDTIPAGASNIDIQQFSLNGSSDDNNYLGESISLTQYLLLRGRVIRHM